MAFLTKKERMLITVIHANAAITESEKVKMVQDIHFKAKVREAGHRLPVREFIQQLALHQAESILKRVR